MKVPTVSWWSSGTTSASWCVAGRSGTTRRPPAPTSDVDLPTTDLCRGGPEERRPSLPAIEEGLFNGTHP